jgi:hypothetical protein
MSILTQLKTKGLINELSSDELKEILQDMLSIRSQYPLEWMNRKEYKNDADILNYQITNYPSEFNNTYIKPFLYKLSDDDLKKIIAERIQITLNNPSNYKSDTQYNLLTNIISIQIQNYPSYFTNEKVLGLVSSVQSTINKNKTMFDPESLTKIYLDIMKNDYLMLNSSKANKVELQSKIKDRVALLEDTRITSLTPEARQYCYNDAILKLLVLIQRDINAYEYTLANAETQSLGVTDSDTANLYVILQKQTKELLDNTQKYFDNIVSHNKINSTKEYISELANDPKYVIQEFYN